MTDKVFLSYRHEGEEHAKRVRGLAERLVQAGLDVVLDQFAQEREFRGGGPDEGWPRWCKRQASDANKVLVIASVSWFKCYQMKEVPGTGLGAAAEARVIEQRIYNASGVNPDIRIVQLDGADSVSLPIDLQPYHSFRDPDDFDDLTSWLTKPPVSESDPDVKFEWPDETPRMPWHLANQSAARSAFEHLLTKAVPGRFLSLCGPSECGKSHLTRLMLGNALRMRGIACGRFDFKGTADVDSELRAFVQHLDVSPPPENGALNEKLSRIFGQLREQARPTVLILDTYEDAGQARDWVERQLLTALIREEWLRVVIAGQVVPPTVGTLWQSEVFSALPVTSPPAEDWLAFSKAHKPHLTIDFVRTAFECCKGKASVMAQLCGPV